MLPRPDHFRADIGGLRALSVLSVLLFHFGLGMPGGYIGVDVFFVISGFLITGNIARDLISGRFRFQTFWERRIRRLMPALVPVTLFAFGIGYWLLSPVDFREFGKSLLFQSFGISNFYFWKVSDTGYFAEDVETRILLHTWSLAVEEQFYLFLPILLWLSYRLLGRTGFLLGLALAGIVSLALSVRLTSAHQSFAFYGLPTRAWEMALGGLVALTFERWQKLASPVREGLSWISLMVLIMGFLRLESSASFPGYLTMVPCLPTALLLGLGPKTQVGRFLSWSPWVWLGELSYSLYLWHWPIWCLAFYPGWVTEDSPVAFRLALAFASLGFAYVAWRWVETPCRFSQRLAAWKVMLVYLGVTVGISALLMAGEGLAWRWSSDGIRFFEDKGRWSSQHIFPLERYRGGADLFDCAAPLGDPKISKVSFVVWGDSHANSLIPMFDTEALFQGVKGYAIFSPSSPPLIVNDVFPGASGLLFNVGLRQAWTKIPEDIVKHRVNKVFLVGRWSQYFHGKPEAVIGETLTKLKALGLEVYFLGDVPRQSVHPPRRLAIATRWPGLSVAPTAPDRAAELGLLKNIEALGLCRCLDPGSLILARDSLAVDGHSAYCDTNHLTEWGCTLVAPMVSNILK